MSRVVPIKRTELVAWYKARLEAWTANATEIGTSADNVADLSAKITAAVAARATQVTALAQARTKTSTFYSAVDAVSTAGAAILKDIRAEGQRTGAPEIWDLAMIPPPAAPSPVGPPGTPNTFSAVLDGNGTLHIKWKCNNPPGAQGTTYQVYRRIGGTGDFIYRGGVGQRSFVDDAIPAGATQLTYQIQAVRSTAVGMWAEFNVNFGTNAGGGMTATVTESAPKLAA